MTDTKSTQNPTAQPISTSAKLSVVQCVCENAELNFDFVGAESKKATGVSRKFAYSQRCFLALVPWRHQRADLSALWQQCVLEFAEVGTGVRTGQMTEVPQKLAERMEAMVHQVEQFEIWRASKRLTKLHPLTCLRGLSPCRSMTRLLTPPTQPRTRTAAGQRRASARPSSERRPEHDTWSRVPRRSWALGALCAPSYLQRNACLTV